MKIMTIFKTGILMDKAINKIAIPKKIKFKYHLLIDLKYIIGLIIFGIILYQFGSVFTIRRLPFLIAFLIFILISGIFNIFKSIEDIAIIKYLVNNHFINLDNEEENFIHNFNDVIYRKYLILSYSLIYILIMLIFTVLYFIIGGHI